MKIKVCGLRDYENIKAVTALGPDYIGFIFHPGSPRFVNDIDNKILKEVPAYIRKTAVFVNESAEAIQNYIDKYGFDAIQLHGTERPEFCGVFRGRVTVLKAFGVNNSFDFSQLNAYADKVDFFLFDTKTDIHGGSGKTFNWHLLNNYHLKIPFFLSGGLSLDNLEKIKNVNHPQFYGVDLNSRFETGPAMKDIQQLEKAFNIIKTYTDAIRS